MVPIPHRRWSHRYGACAFGAACLVIADQPLLAQPKPSPTPISWELKFTFQNPERIQVGGRTYWYMLYHIFNDSGEDRDYMPVIERVAEIESEVPEAEVAKKPDEAARLIVSKSLIGLHPSVFAGIKAKHAKTHPFLVAPVASIGRIKQGRDNAVDSVAIFDDLDPRVAFFTVFVGGLTGERQQLPNPAFDAKKPKLDKNPKFFVIQKTLALPYRLPGDPNTRKMAEPALERLYWVMR